MVYCATSIALATLETVHCLRNGGLPFNRFLLRNDVPDNVWEARLVLDPMPGGWDAIPAGLTARKVGDQWEASSATALLLVASVSVPQERYVLLNPQHPDAAAIPATTLGRWMYDPRFFP